MSYEKIPGVEEHKGFCPSYKPINRDAWENFLKSERVRNEFSYDYVEYIEVDGVIYSITLPWDDLEESGRIRDEYIRKLKKLK